MFDLEDADGKGGADDKDEDDKDDDDYKDIENKKKKLAMIVKAPEDDKH